MFMFMVSRIARFPGKKKIENISVNSSLFVWKPFRKLPNYPCFTLLKQKYICFYEYKIKRKIFCFALSNSGCLIISRNVRFSKTKRLKTFLSSLADLNFGGAKLVFHFHTCETKINKNLKELFLVFLSFRSLKLCCWRINVYIYFSPNSV